MSLLLTSVGRWMEKADEPVQDYLARFQTSVTTAA